MRRTRRYLMTLGFTSAILLLPAAALAALPSAQDPQQPAQEFQPFSAEQLDNLVAPVALYADPLLAQVLLAATFPEEIGEAAQYVRSNGTDGIDDQGWDVSVKAVAHYPTVLNMMDTKSDWTTALGQAYAGQSTDVMKAVQRMRRMAQDQGNLVSSAEQEVVANDEYIRIWPANPRYIYVPVYDPAVVYVRPVFVRPGFHAFFSFGLPFAIGSWLIYDWDWPSWRIYYTGWRGGGWIRRSRPFIVYNTVYLNPVHSRVWYSRDVFRHRYDYGRVRYYEPIHPGVRFSGREGGHWDARGGRTASPGGGDAPRRAVPRAGSGQGYSPRPVPMQTRPNDGVRVPNERRAGYDRPSQVSPGEGRPAVETPRAAPVERRPTYERPRSMPTDIPRAAPDAPRWQPPAESRPAVERPRVEARPSAEPPRWSPPAESRPAVERPRVESRPSEPQRVERPRVESRPSEPQRVERPRTEERPRVDSRPQPQVERRSDPPQRAERGGGGERARPRDH